MKTAARIIVTLIVKFAIITLCLGLVLNWNLTGNGIRSVILPINGFKAMSPSQAAGTSSVSSAELNSEWGDTGMTGLKQYEYGKTLLSQPDKEVYEQIKNALINVEPSVTFKSSDTSTQIKTVFEYVYYDHSELFYLDKTRLSVTGMGRHTCTLKFNYLYQGNVNTINEMKEKVSAGALKMLSGIKGKNDEDKEKELHDAIINTCDYDTTALDNPDGSPESFTVFGVFVNKKAVCNGYAQALKLLLNSMDIKALYVTGIGNGGRHAWNMVNLPEGWRYLDATFDDPVYSYGGQDLDYHTISYDFFNFVSDEYHTISVFDPNTPKNKMPENYAKMPDVE